MTLNSKPKPFQYITTLDSTGDFGMIHLLAIMDDGSNIHNIEKKKFPFSLETDAGLNYWGTNEPDSKVTCHFSLIQCNEMVYATHFFVPVIVTSFNWKSN